MTEDTLTNHPDGQKTLARTLEINGEIYRRSLTGRWQDDKGVMSLLDEWEADLPKREVCTLLSRFEMTSETPRDRPEIKTGVPQIEVTPEMIPWDALEPGLTALLRSGGEGFTATDYAEAVAATVSALVGHGWSIDPSASGIRHQGTEASEVCSESTPQHDHGPMNSTEVVMSEPRVSRVNQLIQALHEADVLVRDIVEAEECKICLRFDGCSEIELYMRDGDVNFMSEAVTLSVLLKEQLAWHAEHDYADNRAHWPAQLRTLKAEIDGLAALVQKYLDAAEG